MTKGLSGFLAQFTFLVTVSADITNECYSFVYKKTYAPFSKGKLEAAKVHESRVIKA